MKKTKSRIAYIAMTLLLLLNIASYSINVNANDTITSASIGDVKFVNQNAKEILNIVAGEKVHVSFTWSIGPGDTGSKIEVQLPSTLLVEEEQSGSWSNSVGEEIGTYQITTDRVLILQLDDALEEGQSGTFVTPSLSVDESVVGNSEFAITINNQIHTIHLEIYIETTAVDPVIMSRDTRTTTYPVFSITSSTTTNANVDTEIKVGDKIHVNFTLSREIGVTSSTPYTFTVNVPKVYLDGTTATLVSPVADNGQPLFVVSGPNEVGDDYVWSLTYNPLSNPDESELVAISLSLKVQLSEDTTITENNTPIYYTSDAGTAQVDRPTIVEKEANASLTKEIEAVYEEQEDGTYLKLDYSNSTVLKAGRIVRFKITVSNDNASSDSITIGAGDLVDTLSSGYSYFDITSSSAVYSKFGFSSTTVLRAAWEVSSIETGYIEYTNVNESTIASGKSVDYYMLAEINYDITDANKGDFINTVAFAEDTDGVGPVPGVDTGLYDMSLATFYYKHFPVSETEDNSSITDINAALNADAQITASLPLGTSSATAYLRDGDKLVLRTYIYNRGLTDTKNNEVVLYVPSCFAIETAYLTANGVPGTLTDITPTFTSAEMSQIKVIYKTDISVYKLVLDDQVTPGNQAYFDVLLTYTYDADITGATYVGAEIAAFEDANDSSKNTANGTITDVDSTPDTSPVNEWYVSSNGSTVYKAEKDNVITQDAITRPTTDDEDDYDYARAMFFDEDDRKSLEYIKNRDNGDNVSLATSLYNIAKSNSGGKYVFNPEYEAASYNSSDVATISERSYVGYNLLINRPRTTDGVAGIQNLKNVVLVDTLPEHMNYLANDADASQYVWCIEVYAGVGQYEDTAFSTWEGSATYTSTRYYPWSTLPTGMSLTIEDNTLTFTADDIGHKYVKIHYLAVPTEITEIDKFVNNATLTADDIGPLTVSNELIARSSNSGATVYAKKYIKIDSAWVEAGSDEALQWLEGGSDSIIVDYRLEIDAYSSGDALAVNTVRLMDDIGINGNAIVEANSGNEYVTCSGVDTNGNPISESTVKGIFSTALNQNNILTIQNTLGVLPADNAKYYFDFTVSYSDLISGQSVYNALFSKTTYTLMPVEISVLKTGFRDTLLSGAEFTLYEDADCQIPVLDENGDPIVLNPTETAATAYFRIADYLTATSGTEWNYYLKETVTPTGYKAVTDIIPITVTKDNEGSLTLTEVSGFDWVTQDEQTGIITIANELETGGIELTKYVEGGTDLVSGASFNLYYKEIVDSQEVINYYKEIDNDGTVIWTTNIAEAKLFVTGQDGNPEGKIQVEILEAGTYYMKEVSAPNGYILNDEEVMFVIDDVAVINNELVKNSITNAKEPAADIPAVDIPGVDTSNPSETVDTFGNSITLFIVAMGISGIIISVVYRKNRKLRSK